MQKTQSDRDQYRVAEVVWVMGDRNRATSVNLRKAVLSLAKPAPQGGAKGSERSSDSSNGILGPIWVVQALGPSSQAGSHVA